MIKTFNFSIQVYLKKMISLLKKNNLVLMLSLFFSFLDESLLAQTSSLDSLLKQIKTAKHDTTYSANLNLISEKFIALEDYKKALNFAKQAKNNSELINNRKLLIASYGNIGLAYKQIADYDSALINYNKALVLSVLIDDKNKIAVNYNNIGNIYSIMGAYKEALSYHIKSLRVCEMINNKKGMAECYNSIGILYWYLNKIENSHEFFLRSLKLNKEINNQQGLANCYNNLTTVYVDKGDLEKALFSLSKSIEIKEFIKDKRGLATSIQNFGAVYLFQKKYDLAMVNFKKSLSIKEKLGDKLGIITSYNGIGNIYSLQGNIVEAEKYFNNSLKLSQEIGSKMTMKSTYQFFFQMHERNGDYQKALKFKKLFTDIKDTLFTMEIEKQMTGINIRYKIEKKDNQIKLLNKDKELKMIELASQKKNQMLISLFSILLVLFIIVLSSFIIKNKSEKQKVRLEKIEKEKIKSELNLLKNQISPHVMFNCLNTIFFQIDEARENAKEMVLLFADLLRYQLYECNVEFIEIEKEVDYLKKFIQIQSLRKSDRCKINFDINENITNFSIAPLLLIPIVENAFKYVSNDKDVDNFIILNLEREITKISFNVKNTTHEEMNENKKQFGGIGLANLKSRLDLIYNDKYSLTFYKENNVFNANLIIYV